jgi:hypothetical protein
MFVMIYFSGDYFLFDSVFIKKKLTKLQILKKRNWFKPIDFGSVQLLGQKPVFSSLALFFPILLGFFSFSSVFRFGSVFYGFGSICFCLGSV